MSHPAVPTLPPTSRPLEVLRRREVWVFALILLTVAVVGAMDGSFLSVKNALDIISDAAPAAIIACAVTMVVVTGEIDISVGSLMGLSAAVLGLTCYGSDPAVPVWIGVLAAIAVAIGVGMLNGLLVTLGRVPSIIVTLGMLTMLRGLTQLIMDGKSIEGRPDALLWLATGSSLGVPLSIWIAGTVVLLTIGLVRHTPLGLRIYAVGSNPKAATLAGISIGWTKFTCFALVGLFTGIATVLRAPKNSLIQSNVGENLELFVVTCVVVGGTSISGGVGTVLGTTLAVLLLAMVPTVLTFIKAPPEWRMAIEGAFILVAVLADQLVGNRRAGRGGEA